MRRILVVSVAVVCTALLGVGSGVRAQSFVPNDINGDGYADLIVGVPKEGLSGKTGAGVVNVVYSNGKKLVSAKNQLVSQAGPMPGRTEPNDLFGSAVELADINGDGYADAIIGSTG